MSWRSGSAELYVDYVTEREASAIRGGFDFGGWHVDHCNRTIVFPAYDVTLPIDTVQRFTDDWKRSGVWALRGIMEGVGK